MCGIQDERVEGGGNRDKPTKWGKKRGKKGVRKTGARIDLFWKSRGYSMTQKRGAEFSTSPTDCQKGEGNENAEKKREYWVRREELRLKIPSVEKTQGGRRGEETNRDENDPGDSDTGDIKHIEKERAALL